MLNPKLVLIADDDVDTRELVTASIELMGHTCITADNGAAAVNLLRQMTPDLAILDVVMPELTGLQVCAELKRQYQNSFVPVLMLTARDELEDKVLALEKGADDYLTKPFHVQELQARARALLRIKELHAQLEATNRELQQMQARLIEQERQMVADQLAGAAAHRLGQPVSAILLNCHLMSQVGAADARYHRAFEAIKNDAKALADMLVDLRAVDAKTTERYCSGVDILKVGKDEAR